MKKHKRFLWSPAATKLLLKLWLQHTNIVGGDLKKSLMHQTVAHKMRMYGPTVREIKTKADNMTKKFKNEFLDSRFTGKPSAWPYFTIMQQILKGSKAVNLSLCLAEKFDFSPMEDTDSDDSTYARKHKAKDIFEQEMEAPKQLKSNTEEISAELWKHPKSEERELESPIQHESKSEESCTDDETSEDSPLARTLVIEERKLAIQKESLKVMKTLADELSSLHREFLKAYKLK
ncbi:uncharacterized protein LOC108596724 [Drosophila busckii]|uniref:uncharacterized protein LOC108596724 n=1 Tax=Drosophila busckii TaxID=30019 RepID=UPI00083EC681|nr:uncharacterized protein LOC108596724 [Drosophila busckii]